MLENPKDFFPTIQKSEHIDLPSRNLKKNWGAIDKFNVTRKSNCRPAKMYIHM